jgi:fluoride exporter
MTTWSVTTVLAIALAGGAGSVLRYLLTLWLQRPSAAFPVSTFAINIGGSFLIGLFARALSTPESSAVLRAALTIGFCGGFTTFSTFSAEFVALVQEGRTLRAVIYVVASVLSGVTAVLAGLALGNRFAAPRG